MEYDPFNVVCYLKKESGSSQYNLRGCVGRDSVQADEFTAPESQLNKMYSGDWRETSSRDSNRYSVQRPSAERVRNNIPTLSKLAVHSTLIKI